MESLTPTSAISASDWEKGVVEKNVQDSWRCIWIDAVKLKVWLDSRYQGLWEEIRLPEHDRFSVTELLEHERQHMLPMPGTAPVDGYVE